ncbi:MAG TPA: rRNA maturation RNase YbeY [Bacteroidales bacterium]|nr:rRNA maturation RNase YbeY [Bacteroidales bacterium]
MISFEYLNILENLTIHNPAKEYLSKIILKEHKSPGTICIIFTDNNSLLDINTRFLQHEYFTDVITFSERKKKLISGDIFISIDQVRLNAIENRIDFQSEICRVIIHGVLHMIGYNDSTPSEKKIMREKEDEYLCQFNWKDVIIDCETRI